MKLNKYNAINFPFSVLAALMFTMLLFIGLPLLTKFQRVSSNSEIYRHVVVSQRKPPPPPEPDRDERIEKKEPEKPKKLKKQERLTMARIDMQIPSFGSNIGGTIKIGGMLDKQEFSISDSLYVSAFKPNEVDQAPKIIWHQEPRFPMKALQSGINGKVTLRFIVTSEGRAKEPIVVESEPEDIFDKAAIEAIMRYKFRPAYKGGKPVDSIAGHVINFKPI